MIGQYVWKDFGRWVHLSHHTIFIEIRNAIWETKRPDFGNQTFAQYINWEKVNNQKRISESILNKLGKHIKIIEDKKRTPGKRIRRSKFYL